MAALGPALLIGGALAIAAARALRSSPGGRLPAELEHLAVTGSGLRNSPPAAAVDNLRRLNSLLQTFAKRIGSFRISSAYRSPEVNRAAGGVSGSLHMQGRAADIVIAPPEKMRLFFDTLRSDPAMLAGVLEELILYETNGIPSHLHLAIPVAGLQPAPTIQTKRRSG